MSKILIVGGGSIGKRHLRNILLLGGYEPGIVEIQSERAVALREEFKCSVFTNFPQALTDFFPEIVFVCSPSIYHLDQAKLAVQHGCHIFIEKPLSHNTQGLKELISLAKEKNIVTMVGSNWKFYPLFKIMKELLDTGAIGRVLSARCQFGQYLPDWHPWEDYRRGYSANRKLGGGVLLDSHEFDYLTWFLGPVKKIVTFAGKTSNLEIDVEDVSETILAFVSGAIGEIHLDYVQRFYQRNYEFFGETGTITWDVNHKKVLVKRVGDEPQEHLLESDYDFNTMYLEELKHFLLAVQNKLPTITPIEKGGGIVTLIEAAKISAAESRVVEL
ncbi:MAG: hypothetical protein A2821_03490 [Candidatus Magasanikbacteria bacterium RIFCSPHIGHO2_01_FULL_41_23]|uniref:Gfo/Idh/MocA-like oxidoreductase N-terminal domain-containing protein n=1 Tax=Candidatus Magasanikbacteria bacterium RIFCSPLOWO2_01_FULL_40_15 TaxID=1798686 RepID=A0A1F6N269_9BACT|nr:MAG: hypothetical protein A2821_03490 [Candidatus Magasanikbacteria bacterium RIFCSPHIGHO2_01_FULL_41_23]OGH66614.1 MAG: hypothetical protein A3C66_03070 [Candidatus Magasanikbacteria bacterium RIFCSPHIGHO2_02_FULL_41_35]OGH74767.1 MAG: hypothetical protein A3F22_00855 [Candidatus Magasanikbacteria bacterium RIFCSPHIGHO2_12_FULL_41_16]OGH77743.1 MAG: hypothetical protein A2983_03830 [Candidatus Magasanikbacteria bacterium RIFCSPLOWO2_01_FULL_40_15]